MNGSTERAVWLALALVAGEACGQMALPQAGNARGVTPNKQTKQYLDPVRDLDARAMQPAAHTPLPEEYLWTEAVSGPQPRGAEQTEPRYFRKEFVANSVPREATLYVAGPRNVKAWLNGTLLADVSVDLSAPQGMHVFAAPAAAALRKGMNTLAMEVARGPGVPAFANTAVLRQFTSGQVMVAKIVPAAEGVMAADLVHTDASWTGSTTAETGWNQPGAGARGWQKAHSLGSIEGNIEFLQWNADAGLYAWPGYEGTSAFLAHTKVPVAKVLATYRGDSTLEGAESLSSGGAVHVLSRNSQWTEDHAPSLLLDFGREITGRVVVESDSTEPLLVSVQMGESREEAVKQPYLGVNVLRIPPGGAGHSPKSAFRYAKLRVLAGGKDVRLRGVYVDHIFYPVQYRGSFESSDALLNRIWETGAYTAHLCMQDGIWDASKRDRGRWMGDLNVSGRVIEDVFGDTTLMEDTLDRLLGPANAPMEHVNRIPGYSTFWFTGVADFYRHTGDREFLQRTHDRMLQLLHLLDAEFDEHDMFVNTGHQWLFVDWSAGLNGETAETRRATMLEALHAYREAAYLLTEAGDQEHAHQYAARAAAIEASSRKLLLDASTGTYGPRWQSNATAVLSGAATPQQYDAIWHNVLSQTVHAAPQGVEYAPITPYYGDYVLRAMAMMDRRAEALAWIRTYWGGMLQEGATSFWEGYDPGWAKDDFHASLQADNRSGYFVSLAHGWSAGPTAWLTEEVLGVQPTAAGFREATIRPELLDLQWMQGSVPTPRGVIQVSVRREGAGRTYEITLPPETRATVSLQHREGAAAGVQVNGKSMPSTVADGRDVVVLSGAGVYHIVD